MNRIAQFLQPVRDLSRRARLLLAAALFVLAGVTGGFVVSRVTMPAADAASADEEDFAAARPARELSPGSRNLLLNIEVTAGLQSAGLQENHPDFGAALGEVAQMTADATSLGPEVPAALKGFLLTEIETAMSALHAGNTARAKDALDQIKSRLSLYRAS